MADAGGSREMGASTYRCVSEWLLFLSLIVQQVLRQFANCHLDLFQRPTSSFGSFRQFRQNGRHRAARRIDDDGRMSICNRCEIFLQSFLAIDVTIPVHTVLSWFFENFHSFPASVSATMIARL